jgi:starch synthase
VPASTPTTPPAPMHRVLHVASEAHPLMKTGGLGDVCGALPSALRALNVDARLLMPAYRDTVAVAGSLKLVSQLTAAPLWQPVNILEGIIPGTDVPVWLVDFPAAFGRPGNPYMNEFGHDWHDNATRFALLCHVAAAIARDEAGLHWQPDILHCHDWQSGLVPALLASVSPRPATVFTIHNLAYQGVFPYETFASLHLPPHLWSLEGLEFHGQVSFIKGGLTFADRLTTVSPTYAREIQTSEFGDGLDGLLRHRATVLRGILNGIDDKTWDPANDALIAAPYSADEPSGKAINKSALQEIFGLPRDDTTPLIGMVGRMVTQKGIDLVIDALPQLLKRPLQLAIIGTGEREFEEALRAAATKHSGRLGLFVGYDERRAHLIEAGADMFLMPSRFEPCGLNQLYSMRYGTTPIVHKVGGLADTVIDAQRKTLSNATATGICFKNASAETLVDAVDRALDLFAQPTQWRTLQQAGMRQDFSWRHRAVEYLDLYNELRSGPKPPKPPTRQRSASERKTARNR